MNYIILKIVKAMSTDAVIKLLFAIALYLVKRTDNDLDDTVIVLLKKLFYPKGKY